MRDWMEREKRTIQDKMSIVLFTHTRSSNTPERGYDMITAFWL